MFSEPNQISPVKICFIFLLLLLALVCTVDIDLLCKTLESTQAFPGFLISHQSVFGSLGMRRAVHRMKVLWFVGNERVG